MEGKMAKYRPTIGNLLIFSPGELFVVKMMGSEGIIRLLAIFDTLESRPVWSLKGK